MKARAWLNPVEGPLVYLFYWFELYCWMVTGFYCLLHVILVVTESHTVLGYSIGELYLSQFLIDSLDI